MPVKAGKYLYVHMPKTGGVWMNNYLIKEHDGLLLSGHGHMPVSEVPIHIKRDKILLGTVRDPWGWYASWWAHAQTSEPGQRTLLSYGGGSMEFARVMEGVLTPVANRTPEKITGIWDIRRPEVERRNFLARGVGLFSWTFDHMHGDLAKKLIDMEQMAKGLHALMGAYVDPDLYPPSNTTAQRPKSKKQNLRKLWTDQLTQMVWEADFALIQRLGYTEPFKPATTPLIQL